ncbi:MAG: 50S ribosomal protein L25 [Planctomycetia bacterium]|nr:50S ribosomal protein L25 [Planctomycetia bacterium]
MSEALKVEPRKTHGKRNARRMRRQGTIPVVLYGHGEKTLSLAVSADQLAAALRHGARVVDLDGAVKEKAFIRELQWDPFGIEVLHVDFTRVSADERVEIEVAIALRGESPGVKEGGHIDQTQHTVEIECLAIAIPEKLELKITGLGLDQSLRARDVELPSGVKLLTDPETVIVHCALPVEEKEEEAPTTEGAEPEIIGRKAEEGEEGAEEA